MKKIKVLIVDNSAVMRQSLAKIFSFDPLVEVIGIAGNPFAAAAIIKMETPDVITMDIEMPGMDGLTFLKKIMTQHPIPVVIIADITNKDAGLASKAMEYGAAHVLARKPYLTRELPEAAKRLLCDTVRTAAGISGLSSTPFRQMPGQMNAFPKGNAGSIVNTNNHTGEHKVIVMGASTGGTQAIEVLLAKLGRDAPGIVVVQHMKEYFTKLFAQRLDELFGMSVKEAEHRDKVIKGRVLIAPGDKHIVLKKTGSMYFVELVDGPLVSRHRPSVDVLFQSAAESAGKDAIGIILTGMGGDGAKGLLKMKQAGAVTIAQDERSCVVFGMPREAIRLHAAAKILPLHEIANYIVKGE